MISSASSKTALIAAHLLAKREGIEVVGLTSAGNREFVEGLDVYHSACLYDDVARLPGKHAIYVDISGDGSIRTDIHAHYGERLAHSAAVGMTHWTQMAQGAGNLDGPSPVFFFDPDRITKRGTDWGVAKLDQTVAEAWAPFARWASDWLRVERHLGRGRHPAGLPRAPRRQGRPDRWNRRGPPQLDSHALIRGTA